MGKVSQCSVYASHVSAKTNKKQEQKKGNMNPKYNFPSGGKIYR